MSQIEVRTALDKAVEEREERIRREFDIDATNPFRYGLLRLKGFGWDAFGYIRASGILFLCCVWWGLYPNYARFRHQHIYRFGRSQVDVRERFFHTKNITKMRVPIETRNGWKKWAVTLAFGRWFQAATDMPEMPDFPL